MSNMPDHDQPIPDSDITQTTMLNTQVRREKEAHGIGDCPGNVRANDRGRYKRNRMRREWATPGAQSFGRPPADEERTLADDSTIGPEEPDASSDAPSVPVPDTPENSLNLSSWGQFDSANGSALHTHTTKAGPSPGNLSPLGTTRSGSPLAASSGEDPTGVIHCPIGQ
ncbi:hypothetical protein PGTUg99_035084 [Puccinia graminis f. sp. tritici]|uniref:Uncharacterized protein n=1 Tax=Puccinia graminis f. sp. tritici TaxID=56615 RepID=A0A5B0RW88_PUCGR|nr:hypothetical protein PGTUg99_035084 [Puccinia graminis f. sp. tritici]